MNGTGIAAGEQKERRGGGPDAQKSGAPDLAPEGKRGYSPPLDASNVQCEFRKIMEAAGLGAGCGPRDLRRTFVSLMSDDGVPIEEIACPAGHNQTWTTELVYRHELRAVITTGAEVMDRILSHEKR